MNSLPRLMVLAGLLLVPFAASTASAQGVVVASDNFNRADVTPFAIGGNWGRVVAGNYNGFSTLTNGQVRSASNEGIYYWQGPGTFNNARQFARQRVVQKNGELGLVLLGGPNHAIMMQWGPPGVNTTLYIYWYANGSDQGVLLTAPATINNGDIIEGVLDNGVIYAKVNGATVASVPNTTTLTSGKPGFITYFNPLLPTQVAILDDWAAGTPLSLFTISGTITENAAGLSGVLVTASGSFSGNATTTGAGVYTIAGVPGNATNIVLTATLSGHSMNPLTRTVAGPVTGNVTGQNFTSTSNTGDAEISDNFNRANETPLAVGSNWIQPFGGGAVNLTGNQVAGTNGEALYYWTGGGTFNNARQYARARVVDPRGQVGLVLLGGPGQALVVSWGSGRLYIYWYNGGGYQGELANEASVIQAGDLIEGVLDNGTIYAKLNGIVVKTISNTTSLTAGKPGFETFQSGAIFDDWGAGTPPSLSSSRTITWGRLKVSYR